MVKHRTNAALVILFALPALLLSAEKPLAGHSSHGEVFNEGPRQAAVKIPGTADVHLDVTTDSPEAQAFFNQGLGQFHGFWDFEAERSFRQAAAIDPDCAMAYWGMAMANFKNDKRGKEFIEEASARKEGVTEAEKMWIDGLAAYYKDTKLDAKKRLRDFVRALEKIATKYPDEIEAQAFLLKQIYYNNGKGLTIPSHYTVNLLAEKILTQAPRHPSNHYRIHLWDKEDAAKALGAAANCGPAAPGIAHMWHMPGHIYSKLHRYSDAAWQQEASARVDHAHMIRFQIVPDQIHNFAHNNEWLIRNLNFLGERDRSISLATNMISLPRRAKFEKEKYVSKGSSWHYGRVRLRDTYVRFAMWDELINESENGRLKPDGQSITQTDLDRYVGIARFESGDREAAQTHLDAVEKRLSEEGKKRDKAVADAEKKAKDSGKDEKAVTAAKTAAEKNFKSKIEPLANAANDLRAYAALTSTPPDTKAALDVLPDLKDLAKWRHASLWQRAGDGGKAEKLATEAVSSGPGEVLPLATQVYVLDANGKSDEAKKAFSKLRNVAHVADPDLVIFESLAPIAAEFGFPTDWQKSPTPATDLGERPPLDTLGPFRWSPPRAADFSLTDADGKTSKLSSKPTLVIFYLGRGCTHCMEQLNAFAPVHEKFAEAGIDIVAISTDSVDGLSQTFQTSEDAENPFPFPLLSDETLSTFKAYRAYDDFEDIPLHGTFLIDSSQRIRWQNISFEPFIHPDWLLEESVRLLALEDPES